MLVRFLRRSVVGRVLVEPGDVVEMPDYTLGPHMENVETGVRGAAPRPAHIPSAYGSDGAYHSDHHSGRNGAPWRG
jgi:hypothetical protein